MRTLEQYLALITSGHNDKPKFMEMMRLVLKPFVDGGAVIANMHQHFDLDNAVGMQLDILGEWIGRSRDLEIPLSNVYFSFDDPNLGFDQGTWWTPFDPVTQLVQLQDPDYRRLLRLKILANNSDGSMESIQAIWEKTFEGFDMQAVFVQDNQDMTMTLGAAGIIPALWRQLVLNGYVPIKPSTVRVDIVLADGTDLPFFAFDLDTPQFAGFDTGNWAPVTP